MCNFNACTCIGTLAYGLAGSHVHMWKADELVSEHVTMIMSSRTACSQSQNAFTDFMYSSS